MLDRNLVANNGDLIRDNLDARAASDEMRRDLDRLIAVISRRRQLQQRPINCVPIVNVYPVKLAPS